MTNSLHVPARAVRRARTLIELLMKEMHASLRDPNRLTDDQWEKLFGAKQSMVMNVHKLVDALTSLPVPAATAQMQEAPAPITTQEMEMLKAWIAESG
jgi:hypothetical protein